MDSILASYTDGVLNIDRADARRAGERQRETPFCFFCFDLITVHHPVS